MTICVADCLDSRAQEGGDEALRLQSEGGKQQARLHPGGNDPAYLFRPNTLQPDLASQPELESSVSRMFCEHKSKKSLLGAPVQNRRFGCPTGADPRPFLVRPLHESGRELQKGHKYSRKKHTRG